MTANAESQYHSIEINGEELLLLPERAILWKRKNALLVSDLHLGKSGHFRKAGIPLPSSVHHQDLGRLTKIIEERSVQKLYLLGDLYHSTQNTEWNHFLTWRKKNSTLAIHLIKGNHDILDDTLILQAEIILHHIDLEEPPFLLIHKSCDSKRGLFQISGHLHPAIRLSGKGRQSATFPCFWFRKNCAVLPAFGNFTGNALISSTGSDNIFFIAGSKVIAFNR